MVNRNAISSVGQPFVPVKSQLNTQLPLWPESVIHHSNHSRKRIEGNRDKIWREIRYYGVSSEYRLLTKGLFAKRRDQVRDFLKYVLRFTVAQRDFTLRLLEFWAHYGKVYPKIALLCEEPGCSVATAWRTVALLERLGLIERVNRIMKPTRRQISNLYLLHGLILLIARYLAEHGTAFYQKWLQPYLALTGAQFWHSFALPPGKPPSPAAGLLSSASPAG